MNTLAISGSTRCQCENCQRSIQDAGTSFELGPELAPMDPLPELVLKHVVTMVESRSIDVWRSSRALWPETQVREDIHLAVQSAVVINNACAEGTEPHPLVAMLATSDPVIMAHHFNRDEEHIMARAVWWMIGTLGTVVTVLTALAMDVLTRI